MTRSSTYGLSRMKTPPTVYAAVRAMRYKDLNPLDDAYIPCCVTSVDPVLRAKWLEGGWLAFAHEFKPFGTFVTLRYM